MIYDQVNQSIFASNAAAVADAGTASTCHDACAGKPSMVLLPSGDKDAVAAVTEEDAVGATSGLGIRVNGAYYNN